MLLTKNSMVVRAETSCLDPVGAVAELQSEISRFCSSLAGLIVYRAPHYEHEGLAQALSNAFSCPIVSCTTAGEIGDKYRQNGILAIGFSASHFAFHTLQIPDLRTYDLRRIAKEAAQIESGLRFSKSFKPSAMFALLLVDGLSTLEEQLVAPLHQAFGGIPLIGGSAGDNLDFRETFVLCQGRYQSNAATFTVIESLMPFEPLRVQHFEPSSQDLVITSSDPRRRIVYEIDGGPAAWQFADLLGLKVEQLSPHIFSKYPVMLQIGREWYVRSVQKVNDDGSLTFFCAIDDGLPLTVAKGVGLADTLEKNVVNLEQRFSQIHLTLGIDCILRRLEVQEKGLEAFVEPLLKRLRFAGFSGYGEQFNSLHVNQTLTSIVLGEPREL